MDPTLSDLHLHPFFGTYARFFIGSILSFKPHASSRKVFLHPKGHPINKVEVFGFITQKVEKFDCIKISVDDGTGTIFCFINKPGVNRKDSARETVGQFIERSVISDFGQNSPFTAYITDSTDVRIGDFVQIQADLIPSRWNVNPQLVMQKISKIKEPILETWSKWTKETITLNEAVYSKSFQG